MDSNRCADVASYMENMACGAHGDNVALYMMFDQSSPSLGRLCHKSKVSLK